MKVTEIRDFTNQELESNLADLKKELFNLRFQNATNQLENPMRIVEVKKTIARIKTVLAERKLEEEAKIAAADDYQFGQWLNEYYSADEIWNMAEAEKEEVNADWLKYCREGMEEELGFERRVLM